MVAIVACAHSLGGDGQEVRIDAPLPRARKWFPRHWIDGALDRAP
jgi:hypothetical protein